jgi:hypothetical protein
MRKKKTNYQELRRLASDYIEGLVEEGDILPGEKGDFTTSLVRQWLTYDGHATLFLDGQQVYLLLDRSPLGKLRIMANVDPLPWQKDLTEQWKIDPQELPDIFDQLNRGQSADVTSDDGLPLRLWVNPKEGRRGVEDPGRRRVPPGWKPPYHKVAANTLQRFSGGLDPDELEKLIDSVARQWQKYEGHACLFFQRAMFAFILTEVEDGCHVTSDEVTFQIQAVLASYDVSPEDIPEMIAKINLGQEIEFRNSKGILCRLWHDPKARAIRCTPVTPPLREVSCSLPPVFCPNCGATLLPWEEGQQQQRCPWCSQTVARTGGGSAA